MKYGMFYFSSLFSFFIFFFAFCPQPKAAFIIRFTAGQARRNRENLPFNPFSANMAL
jgi:hypothetical protein